MIEAVNRARAVLTAFLLASALGLAGCTDDPEPRFAPPSSAPPASPSTSAASGPTAPEMPEAAKGTDAAAAEAFVKYYWEVVNYAEQSRDLSELRRISSDRCVACQAGIDYLERVFAQDAVISGGINRVLGPRTVFVAGERGRDAVVEFELRSTRQHIAYPDADDDVYRGGRSSMRARLQPAEVAWTMFFWGESD